MGEKIIYLYLLLNIDRSIGVVENPVRLSLAMTGGGSSSSSSEVRPSMAASPFASNVGIEEEDPKWNKYNTAAGELVSSTKNQTEIPSQMLRRLLLTDERVTGQFDFFYVQNSMTTSQFYWRVVLSFGMYLVYHAFVWMIRTIRKACCTCSFCQDSVSFSRGKLVVTSKGRLICWSLDVDQSFHPDGRCHHSVVNVSHILKVSINSMPHRNCD